MKAILLALVMPSLATATTILTFDGEHIDATVTQEGSIYTYNYTIAWTGEPPVVTDGEVTHDYTALRLCMPGTGRTITHVETLSVTGADQPSPYALYFTDPGFLTLSFTTEWAPVMGNAFLSDYWTVTNGDNSYPTSWMAYVDAPVPFVVPEPAAPLLSVVSVALLLRRRRTGSV